MSMPPKNQLETEMRHLTFALNPKLLSPPDRKRLFLGH